MALSGLIIPPPISSIMVIVSGFGYVFISTWLLLVFIRQLLDLATNKIVTLKVETKRSLSRETASIELSFNDQAYINLIAKYFVLGSTSFGATTAVLIATIIQFVLEIDIMYGMVKILTMIDIIANITCIYLQYGFAKSKYRRLCGKFDKCVDTMVHKRAVRRIREDTFSFYMDKFGLSVEKSRAASLKKNMQRTVALSASSNDLLRIPSNSPGPGRGDNNGQMSDEEIDFDKLINFKAVKDETKIEFGALRVKSKSHDVSVERADSHKPEEVDTDNAYKE